MPQIERSYDAVTELVHDRPNRGLEEFLSEHSTSWGEKYRDLMGRARGYASRARNYAHERPGRTALFASAVGLVVGGALVGSLVRRRQ